jgi:hypothetical protein
MAFISTVRLFPRSTDCGPIEVALRCSVASQQRDFRDQLIAAPLNHAL